MTTPSRATLFEATRLTRAGRLDEAIALLQAGLGFAAAAVPATATAPIDRKARLVPHPARRLPPPAPSSAAPVADTTAAATAPPAQRPASAAQATRAALPDWLRTRSTVLPTPAAALLKQRGPRRPTPVLPDGARFEAGQFAASGSGGAYRLFIPGGHEGRPLPLLVMLHGCTQTPEDFAAGTRMNEMAQAQGLLVAWPEQPASANASRCWNWFSADDQGRDQGCTPMPPAGCCSRTGGCRASATPGPAAVRRAATPSRAARMPARPSCASCCSTALPAEPVSQAKPGQASTLLTAAAKWIDSVDGRPGMHLAA